MQSVAVRDASVARAQVAVAEGEYADDRPSARGRGAVPFTTVM